jgi:tryptophan-rich sensory protein
LQAQALGGRRRADLLALVGFLALCLVVGAVGGLVTSSSLGSWYPELRKPSFNPPNGVFGPVWTTLYVLMAIAAWRVFRRRDSGRLRSTGLALWGVQLALNLGWSCLFFGLRSPAAALAEIVVLLAAIAATASVFWRVDRPAGILLVPYLAWVAFASALNFEIWRLNPA